MYRIIIAPEAKKRLKTISRMYQEGIAEAIKALQDEPYLGKSLTRELTGRYSYRIGVYRIVYKINEKEKTVNIIDAGHRSTIYQ